MPETEVVGQLTFAGSESTPARPEPAVSASLVAALRRGDRSAFDRLYRMYAPLVHGILLARVPRDDVDDLVQDVFLSVIQNLHSLRDDLAFGGWLATLARNRAVDFYRQTRRTEEIPPDIPAASTTEARVAAKQILAVVRSLPDTYRETLVLRLVEGMTGPEIAAYTGMTHASVRVNLHRGMHLLRERLGLEK